MLFRSTLRSEFSKWNYWTLIITGKSKFSNVFFQITMVNAQFSKHVASMETREGCPITPGASFTKQFFLIPLASSNKDRRGNLTLIRQIENAHC